MIPQIKSYSARSAFALLRHKRVIKKQVTSSNTSAEEAGLSLAFRTRRLHHQHRPLVVKMFGELLV